MYLQSIQVDGFKSYSSKTTIGPFSANFNCISGLNGSGKSNILDAITFVIGCKDLSLMRCTHLSDLIYKQGNAHIKRASVSLIFNNNDKMKSPSGFENLDEIIITRICSLPNKTKYLLNGNAINNIQVQSLFASIGLNPATPNNYIIFQGKITKIIMMKPYELSLLLKEAAGTLHYEQRKDNAEKVLNKKNLKVQEIQDTLDTDVLPKIKEYQKQRNDYLELKQLATELESKIKFVINLEFSWSSNHLTKVNADYQIKEQSLVELSELKASLQSSLNALHKQIKSASTKSTNPDLESKFKQSQLELTKQESSIQFLSRDIHELQNELKLADSKLSKLSSQFASLSANSQSIQSNFNKAKHAYDKSQSQLSILSSMVNGELEIEIERIDQLLITAQSNVTNLNNQIHLLQQEWSTCYEPKYKSAKSQLQQINDAKFRIQSDSQNTLNQVRQLTNNDPIVLADYTNQMQLITSGLVAELGQFTTTSNKLQQSLKSHSHLKQQLNNELQHAKRPLSSIYNIMALPTKYPNLKHGLIGAIATLIKCNVKFNLPISISGGNKLRHVVVEKDDLAAYILKNIKLDQRTTFVPLNSLVVKPLSNDKIVLAKTFGNVYSIHDLLEYDIKYKNVIEYCFGHVLFCETSNVAESVAFNKQILVKCITLQGDVYDPSGLVSGGSAPKDVLMAQIAQINVSESKLADMDSSINKIKKEKDELELKYTTLSHYSDQLTNQLQQYSLVDKQRINGNYEMIISESESHLQSIKDKQTSLQTTMAQITELQEQHSYSNKGNKQDLTRVQNEANKHKIVHDKCSALLEQHQAELADLSTEIENTKNVISDVNLQLATINKQLQQAQLQYTQIELLHTDLASELEAQMAMANKHNLEQQQMQQQLKEIKQQLDTLQIQEQQVSHELQVWQGELKKTKKRLLELEGQGAVLIESTESLNDHMGLLNEMQSKYDQLKLNVNQQVMSMIDVAEQEELKLAKMLQQVRQDKQKIEGAIEELDKHKITAVDSTWREVTESFGKILQGILPGSTAKLVPLESGVVDGCEIRVELNGKWKESLSELSGGQRSLVAISLILSLLQFKTSPLYILDEVDAGNTD